MKLFLLTLFFGCIDRAPKDSSHFQRAITFRTRNQMVSFSRDMGNLQRDVYMSKTPKWVKSPVQNGLSWLSAQLQPPNYDFGNGCFGYREYYFEQYTLFSHWENSVVEEDKYDSSFELDPKDFDSDPWVKEFMCPIQ